MGTANKGSFRPGVLQPHAHNRKLSCAEMIAIRTGHGALLIDTLVSIVKKEPFEVETTDADGNVFIERHYPDFEAQTKAVKELGLRFWGAVPKEMTLNVRGTVQRVDVSQLKPADLVAALAGMRALENAVAGLTAPEDDPALVEGELVSSSYAKEDPEQ